MKLNPPASSSDLDAARAIAHRLHRRAQGHERTTDGDHDGSPLETERRAPVDAARAEAEPVTPAAPFGEPDRPAGSPLEPEAAASAVSEPGLPEPEAAPPEPAPLSALEAALPPPPIVEESPVEPPMPPEIEPPAGDDALAELPEAAPETAPDPEEPTLESLASEPPTEGEVSEDSWAGPATPAEGVTAPPDIDPESAFGELGATPDAGAVLEGLEPPAEAGSPEDLVEDGAPGWSEESQPMENPIEAEPEPERPPDDVVAPASPSWDDVADSCLAIARAHAAMVVDPSGQVLSARGDWPEPGPEAIGGRLVSMMEKTLQDAPTRSVSAPLAGRHLTAWRVPASEGYYTIVFMGEAPLGADVRSPVDVEIQQALGR